jgi:hypothetical protein
MKGEQSRLTNLKRRGENVENWMTINALDHVQLAMPPGREADVRGFYEPARPWHANGGTQ